MLFQASSIERIRENSQLLDFEPLGWNANGIRRTMNCSHVVTSVDVIDRLQLFFQCAARANHPRY